MFSSAFLFRNGLFPASAQGAVNAGLGTLLGSNQIGNLPVAAIDDLVRNEGLVPLTEKARLTPGDLQKATTLLRNLQAETHPAQMSYLERLETLTQGPEPAYVRRYLERHLVLRETSEPVYAALSDEAREALYILMARGNVPGPYLENFLANPAVRELSGEHEQILQMVQHLDNLRVENVQSAFLPTVNDGKLIFGESNRVHAVSTELKQGFWMALNTDATRVVLDAVVPIDWSQLRPDETRFLRERVHPDLDDTLRLSYLTHLDAKTDALVLRRNGGRLVEIKSSRASEFRPDDHATAKDLLQIFRYALAVRRWRLQGIEYIIDAPDVSPRFLGALTETLELTKVPYLLRVINHRERVTRKGLDYPVLHRRPPVRRTRPLPWPVESNGGDAPKSEPGKKSSDRPKKTSDRPARTEIPWTPEMRAVLDRVWPKGEGGVAVPALSIKQRTVEDFVEQAQNLLRRPHRPELLANLRKVVEETRNASLRDALEADLEEIRRLYATQGETLSRDALKRLVRFAATATAKSPSSPPSEGSERTALKSFLRRFRGEVETNLRIHSDLWETELHNLNDLLRSDPPTTPDDRVAYRNMLEEWSPDAPYLRQWSIREIAGGLALALDIPFPEDLRGRLTANLAMYDDLHARLE